MKTIKIHTPKTGFEFFFVEDSHEGKPLFVCSFYRDFADYWLMENLDDSEPIFIDGYSPE